MLGLGLVLGFDGVRWKSSGSVMRDNDFREVRVRVSVSVSVRVSVRV